MCINATGRKHVTNSLIWLFISTHKYTSTWRVWLVYLARAEMHKSKACEHPLHNITSYKPIKAIDKTTFMRHLMGKFLRQQTKQQL